MHGECVQRTLTKVTWLSCRYHAAVAHRAWTKSPRSPRHSPSRKATLLPQIGGQGPRLAPGSSKSGGGSEEHEVLTSSLLLHNLWQATSSSSGFARSLLIMPFATSLRVVDGPSVKSCCLTPSVSGGTSGTCPETLRDSEGLNFFRLASSVSFHGIQELGTVCFLSKLLHELERCRFRVVSPHVAAHGEHRCQRLAE